MQKTFEELGLAAPLLRALKDTNYMIPFPIQTESIPHLLDGGDLLGQAQTGTGKTASFGLPMLSHIDLERKGPQALVLAPTRELANQVTGSLRKYARYLKGFRVLSVYGGQSYGYQLRELACGPHVIVGTPGRVMDHMRRGTLQLDQLRFLVLDEADKMLHMGFIDDVEWILKRMPTTRQMALFSATMPDPIRRVAQNYLNSPKEVKITKGATPAETIRQRLWQVNGVSKLDALNRIIEAEPFDGMLVFVNTKIATEDLAEELHAIGHDCAALNGDMPQALRERTMERLRKGQLNILVATDVAARGLDVTRVSHVINYDIPNDGESYVHRIGRTGRAGRSGEAILFVGPREKHLLRSIEKAIGKKIEPMKLPTIDDINSKRIAHFKKRITDTLATQELEVFQKVISEYQDEQETSPLEISAALACLVQGDQPLLLKKKKKEKKLKKERTAVKREFTDNVHGMKSRPLMKMVRYRVEVGLCHGVKPGNILGAIANEAGLESKFIGHIKIHENYSTVDLPEGMPREIYRALKNVWVCRRKLEITQLGKVDGSDGKKSRKNGSRKPQGTKFKKTRGRDKAKHGGPKSLNAHGA